MLSHSIKCTYTSYICRSSVGGEYNRETVSCRAVRACVSAHGLVALVLSQPKWRTGPFPSPFGVAALSLLPLAALIFRFSL